MINARCVSRLTAIVLICTLALLACSRPPRPSVNDLLKERPFRDSFYACLLNGIAQHLKMEQIQKDCETKLTFNGAGGLDRSTPDLGPARHDQSAYDPASLQAKCASGDPGRGAGSAVDTNRVGYGFVVGTTVYGRKEAFPYTFGGKGQTGGFAANEHGEWGIVQYKGLSEEQAKTAMQDAVDKWLEAVKELADLVAKQTADLKAQGKDPGDWEKDPQMRAARDAAFKKLSETYKNTQKDPNVGGFGGVSRPAPSSACQDALQEAREIIGECQMTGWKSAGCQSLQARLQQCPDPALVYVDPEQGYTCRPAIDPEALRQAWVDRCEQLKRPTVDGSSPCSPPQVDANSRFITPTDQNPVCGGPQVYVTPDVEPDRSCVHTLNLPTFEQSTHQIYVWGLKNLGGPIVVFGPRTNSPPPTPGPEPRPVP